MKQNTNERVTLLTIRYISLVGEALSQSLKYGDLDDVGNLRKIVRVLETCFDRCEHIAQYELDSSSSEKFKLGCLARDVEWLQVVVSTHADLLSQGVQRLSTKPTPEQLQQLLREIRHLIEVN